MAQQRLEGSPLPQAHSALLLLSPSMAGRFTPEPDATLL
jgi:hypothetical protein